jgi:hypothetical protein
MVDLTKLPILKDKMIKAKDFADPCNYFLDHFGENPAFMRAGAPADAAFLKPILERIGQRLLNQAVALTVLPAAAIADHHFLHGACLFNGKLASFFYFRDIDMGILTLLQSPTSGVVMARFSCVYPSGRAAGNMH